MSKGNSGETSGRLRLVFDGRAAADGVIALDEYASALGGWQEFFAITGELYLQSLSEGKSLRGKELLRIEIVAERRGSFEVVLAFLLGNAAGGTIGNRTDAVVVWAVRKLFAWYKKAVQRHLSTKKRTTNILELVKALEELAGEEGISLQPEVAPSEDDQLTLIANDPEVLEEEDEADVVNEEDRTRILVEKIDQSLELATRPLENSAETLRIETEDGQLLLAFGAGERSIIAEPLTLPPPSGDWTTATVQFVRINRRTGKALFSYVRDGLAETTAHYSRISDPSVKHPGNVYTTAFSAATPLNVYLRPGKAERGTLKHTWEITVHPPEGPLFSKRLE